MGGRGADQQSGHAEEKKEEGRKFQYIKKKNTIILPGSARIIAFGEKEVPVAVWGEAG